MATLLGIAVRDQSRAPMKLLDTAQISVEKGIDGDYRGHGGCQRARQISIITRESWDAAERDLNHSLPWTTRRANLLVEGVALSERSVGKQLRVGETVVLEITGETDPCQRMDEARPGLRKALEPDWRGGVLCRVVRDGIITVNDAIHLD
ncbi:MAG: MOSC domain-containing protein [Candidatus Poribacteria bacterium]|nr:MOSC domain-containing protein [Candidatus Poribacteria bacterium]